MSRQRANGRDRDREEEERQNYKFELLQRLTLDTQSKVGNLSTPLESAIPQIILRL